MPNEPLDQEWSGLSLLRFALPTIVMMVFMGLYTLVDTIFVARFVNTDALSAINIVCPVVNLTVGLGSMIAAGGNAIVSRSMGAGRLQEACQVLTQLVLMGVAAGLLLFAAGTLWIGRIVYALGSSELLFPYCRDYLEVLLLFAPANILQTLFSHLLVTAGKQRLGLTLSVLAGVANLILDYIFIVPCGLGIRGAALGTGIGYLIPAAAGALYFGRNTGALSFVRPRLRGSVAAEVCFNGSSELVGQLASAVTTFLFNITMMDLLGEDGVAAVTVMSYAQFLMNTLFIGFSMGAAPVIGYNYGNGDRLRQRRVLRVSLKFISVVSLALFLSFTAVGPHIVRLFAGEMSPVCQIAERGFAVFSYSLLFCGLNIFVSAMCTACHCAA